ncbi:plasmid partitioning protein RepB [Tabrizicola sp. YIM 78059]|uniref:plasmid partitioning protein RepB n=1 Tax=Tabrizicola sp. YIM 78059 TaxID=2529861 RepID=UPI0010AA41F6|nr:plasmid partitioning protein RepB [Tabrizicola sp. YIM 78059]
MARKDLLKGLMEGPAEGEAPPPSPAPRLTRGAIGAVSRSIADLKERALIEVPADLIDDAGLPDRLDADEAGIAALADSIRQHGQQVPVLLRHSPNYEGRYEVVYGRRRVAALRRLGLPVRALLRNLSDRELIVAQGQENAARKDLSFIEKAMFARAMESRGFPRAVICEALHADKTVISRMLTVADSLPEALIRAIGAAPSAGRDRWLALAARLRGRDPGEMIAAAQGADSDSRFRAVFEAAGRPPARPRAEADLRGDGGAALGRVRRGKGRVSIDLSGEGAAFADWLLDRIEELHRSWRGQTGGKD